MGDEKGIIKFELPDSCLMAYPTEARVTVSEGSGSRRACRRGKIRLYWGVMNSRPGTGSVGASSGNGDELVFCDYFSYSSTQELELPNLA